MSNSYLMLQCRPDQTFRFPRDMSIYADRIRNGAVVRMHMAFGNGASLSFASGAESGGVFNLDDESSIGVFVASLAHLRTLSPDTFNFPCRWFARIEDGGEAETIMFGDAVWSLSNVLSVDSELTGTDGLGATVFVLGEDDPVGVVPVSLATVLDEARAARDAAAGYLADMEAIYADMRPTIGLDFTLPGALALA